MSIHPVMAAIVGAALLLGGCGDHGDGGPTTSETLSVEAFDAIDVEGGVIEQPLRRLRHRRVKS